MCCLISVWFVCVSAVHGYLFMQVTICECSYECVFRANRFTDMPMHAWVVLYKPNLDPPGPDNMLYSNIPFWESILV